MIIKFNTGACIKYITFVYDIGLNVGYIIKGVLIVSNNDSLW